MTRQHTDAPPLEKTLAFMCDKELLAALERHREVMDSKRPEGAGLTSMGEAIRNLLHAGLRWTEER